MPDLTLTADLDDLEPGGRPTRLVTTGLAPTAEVPTRRRRELPPCYGPCDACGHLVLTGVTATGQRLAVELDQQPLYVVLYDAGAPLPRLVQSQGYPAHHCEAAPAQMGRA